MAAQDRQRGLGSEVARARQLEAQLKATPLITRTDSETQAARELLQQALAHIENQEITLGLSATPQDVDYFHSHVSQYFRQAKAGDVRLQGQPGDPSKGHGFFIYQRNAMGYVTVDVGYWKSPPTLDEPGQPSRSGSETISLKIHAPDPWSRNLTVLVYDCKTHSLSKESRKLQTFGR